MIFAKKMIVITAAFLALCTSSFGADTSGKVLGTVIDPSGNPVPQAAVALTNKATGVKQAAMTDGQGGFAFPVVPVGAYDFKDVGHRQLSALQAFGYCDRPGQRDSVGSSTRTRGHKPDHDGHRGVNASRDFGHEAWTGDRE